MRDDGFRPRRILAVLECRSSDDAVVERAGELASESGGYLTVVAVAPRPFPFANPGPYCLPRVTPEELRDAARDALRAAVARLPPDLPLIGCVDEGRVLDVVRRRVEVAAHDLVVVRSRLAARAASRLRSASRVAGAPARPVDGGGELRLDRRIRTRILTFRSA